MRGPRKDSQAKSGNGHDRYVMTQNHARMESRTVKPQNQLPNILRPSMPRHVSVIDYFKIARTPEILSIYPFCRTVKYYYVCRNK